MSIIFNSQERHWGPTCLRLAITLPKLYVIVLDHTV